MATISQIIWDARCLAQERNADDPNPREALRIAEEALQKIGKLIIGVDPRAYCDVTIFNEDTSAGYGVYNATGVFDPATKTLQGDFSSTPNANGIVIGYAHDEVSTGINFFAYAVSKTDTIMILDRDIFYGLGTPGDVKFIYIPALGGLNPTLTFFSSLQLESVVKITGTRGKDMRELTIDEFLAVANNPNYSSSSVFYVKGRAISTRQGVDLTEGPGVCFAFYKRKPRSVVRGSQYDTTTTVVEDVDLPIQYHQILRDEIAKNLMIRKGKNPPPEFQDPTAPLVAQMNINQKALELARQRKLETTA